MFGFFWSWCIGRVGGVGSMGGWLGLAKKVFWLVLLLGLKVARFWLLVFAFGG